MAALITAVLAMAVVQVAAVTATPVTVGLETAAKVVVPVTVDLIAAAVQVVAAARVIPVVTNPAVVAKAVPQSHQRNSLL